MPFEIVRNDITKMSVDAIVNTANPRPVIGLGTDSMIHEAAGPSLLIARQAIGRIDVGCAEITPAFNLQAKYVIHTVGPVWDGGSYGEEKSLRGCYDNSLKLAVEHKCKSIAFPLISTGNYGFPKDKALQIAISAFSEFLLEHEMQIYLVVFDRTSFKLSELCGRVRSCILWSQRKHSILQASPSGYGSLRKQLRSGRNANGWSSGGATFMRTDGSIQGNVPGRYAQAGRCGFYRNPFESD